MKHNPLFRISKFFEDTVAEMTASDKQRITKQLGGFPKTYNEQSELDAKRVKQAENDAKKFATTKAQAKDRRSGFKKCACCGEEFRDYGRDDLRHCAVCISVFGSARQLETIHNLSDDCKCELYKIRRAKCNDEIKSMTPTELHQNLPPKLNIRLQNMNVVAMTLMREKLDAQALENEKREKSPFRCRKCGDVYFLEGKHPKSFICDRCKRYEAEHRKGTKLRKLPGLPSMTYEHLALLPEYAACMFTKHMTDEELEKLRKIKAKVNPSRKTFSEHITVM